MNALPVERGISMRELERLWREHGGTVVGVRRTGEVRYVYPLTQQRSGMVSNRRKDAPLKLLTFVRRILSEIPGK